MSRKSLTSLLKLRILDSGLALVDRKKSLRDLPRPSRRFLQGLIDSTDTPPELRRAAARMLVDILSDPKAKPVEPTSLSVSEPPQESGETPKVIDPEAWKLDPKLAEILSPEPLKARESAELGKPARTGIPKPEGIYE